MCVENVLRINRSYRQEEAAFNGMMGTVQEADQEGIRIDLAEQYMWGGFPKFHDQFRQTILHVVGMCGVVEIGFALKPALGESMMPTPFFDRALEGHQVSGCIIRSLFMGRPDKLTIGSSIVLSLVNAQAIFIKESSDEVS